MSQRDIKLNSYSVLDLDLLKTFGAIFHLYPAFGVDTNAL